MNLMETEQQLILAYETVLQPTSTIQARKDAENVHTLYNQTPIYLINSLSLF